MRCYNLQTKWFKFVYPDCSTFSIKNTEALAAQLPHSEFMYYFWIPLRCKTRISSCSIAFIHSYHLFLTKACLLWHMFYLPFFFMWRFLRTVISWNSVKHCFRPWFIWRSRLQTIFNWKGIEIFLPGLRLTTNLLLLVKQAFRILSFTILKCSKAYWRLSFTLRQFTWGWGYNVC